MAPSEIGRRVSGIRWPGQTSDPCFPYSVLRASALVLLDVGIDDATDIVVLVFVVFQKRVVFFLVVILDDDVLDVVLVDDLHADAFGFGLLDGFLFLILASGSDNEWRFVRNRLDDFLGVLALLLLVLGLLVVRLGRDGLRRNRFGLARTALLVQGLRLKRERAFRAFDGALLQV